MQKKANKTKKTQKANVVVFDFDGTLSAHDSNFEFARYCFQRSVRPWLFLPLMGVASIVRLVNRPGVWWRESMRRFLSVQLRDKYLKDFIKQHKQERFGWVVEQVAAEREAGNMVVLISASTNYFVPALVSDINFDAIITSQMEDKYPWKYKFLCWGPNKVVALNAWAEKNNIKPHVVRSYTDSKSDMPLVKIADEAVWINRKTGCRVSK